MAENQRKWHLQPCSRTVATTLMLSTAILYAIFMTIPRLTIELGHTESRDNEHAKPRDIPIHEATTLVTQSSQRETIRPLLETQVAKLPDKRTETDSNTTQSHTCNLTAFQEQLQLDTDNPVVPVHLLSGCKHVFYNKVPKTACRSVNNVLSRVMSTHGVESILSKPQIMRNLLQEFRRYNNSFYFHGHIHYRDFKQYFPHSSVYINVIRDPTEWFISLYNFVKYKDDGRVLTEVPSLDRCVNTRESYLHSYFYCTSLYHEYSPMHYLCGDEAVCETKSQSSLNLAKQRLQKDYLVVGLTEMLPEYFEVLEFLMPQMFSGSLNVYKEMKQKFMEKTKTIFKEKLDTESYKLLKSKLHMDYELYHVVSQRFHKLLRAVRRVTRQRSV